MAGKKPPGGGAQAPSVEVAGDIGQAFPVGIAAEQLPDQGRGALIHGQAGALPTVAQGHDAADKLPFGDGLLLAPADVLRQVGRVIFRHGFQQALQDDALRGVGDVLHDGHHPDAALLQLRLVDGRVVAIAREAVQLPDNHDGKLPLLRVLDHPLKIRPRVPGAGERAVHILPNDGIPVFLREAVGVVELSLNGLLRLIVRGVPGIDDGVGHGNQPPKSEV